MKKVFVSTLITLSLGLLGAACSNQNTANSPVSNTQVNKINSQENLATDGTTNNNDNLKSTDMNSQPSAVSEEKKSGYTIQQVADANSAQKCWTVIDGNVYDLTSWIYQHPGGPQYILMICGKDATSAFNSQHGGQGKPERVLGQYYLSKLN